MFCGKRKYYIFLYVNIENCIFDLEVLNSINFYKD